MGPLRKTRLHRSRSKYCSLTRDFNPSSVERLLSQGDEAIAAGGLETARKHYDNARDILRALAGFYRDLSGGFRGLDARVPREMNTKGRRSILPQAEASLRLAALCRRLEQPEVAVPLLVEVINLLTVPNPMGVQTCQQLVELGFAETTYEGPNQSLWTIKSCQMDAGVFQPSGMEVVMSEHHFVIMDRLWKRIAPVLPGKATDRGVTARDNRLFLEAVLQKMGAGVP